MCIEWMQCKGVLRQKTGVSSLTTCSMTDGNAGVHEEVEEKRAR